MFRQLLGDEQTTRTQQRGDLEFAAPFQSAALASESGWDGGQKGKDVATQRD